MRKALFAIVIVASPAGAYDLGKITQRVEAVHEGPRSFFEAERCIVMADGLNAPTVYRTPDRPNESLIYYPLNGMVSPIVYRLEKIATGTRVTIHNGLKYEKYVKACLAGAQ